MSTSVKHWVDMAQREGLIVDRVEKNKSFKLYVRAVDGRTTMITAPFTPSCHRADANMRAVFRRFARGQQK